MKLSKLRLPFKEVEIASKKHSNLRYSLHVLIIFFLFGNVMFFFLIIMQNIDIFNPSPEDASLVSLYIFLFFIVLQLFGLYYSISLWSARKEYHNKKLMNGTEINNKKKSTTLHDEKLWIKKEKLLQKSLKSGEIKLYERVEYIGHLIKYQYKREFLYISLFMAGISVSFLPFFYVIGKPSFFLDLIFGDFSTKFKLILSFDFSSLIVMSTVLLIISLIISVPAWFLNTKPYIKKHRLLVEALEMGYSKQLKEEVKNYETTNPVNKSSWYWYFKGWTLYFDGEIIKTIELLEKVKNYRILFNNSLKGELRFLLGRCYYQLEEYDKALLQFKETHEYFLKTGLEEPLNSLKKWQVKLENLL